MYPMPQYRQELARERYADVLREARLDHIQQVRAEERERSPIARLSKLALACGAVLRRGARARAPEPAPRVAAS